MERCVRTGEIRDGVATALAIARVMEKAEIIMVSNGISVGEASS